MGRKFMPIGNRRPTLVVLALTSFIVAEAAPAYASGEKETFDAMARHLAEHAELIQAGKYPDGTDMEPICAEFGFNVCASEAFLSTRDQGRTLTAAAIVESADRIVIDVRGLPEREHVSLSEAADHVIPYGEDAYDPITIGELDREAFAESVLTAVGDHAAPVSVVCSFGVRSRAAAMALREAGFTDVTNTADGVLGNPAGGGLAAALGIEVPPLEEAGSEQSQ